MKTQHSREHLACAASREYIPGPFRSLEFKLDMNLKESANKSNGLSTILYVIFFDALLVIYHSNQRKFSKCNKNNVFSRLHSLKLRPGRGGLISEMIQVYG